MLNFCIYCLSTHSDACKEINREKKVKLQEKSTSLGNRNRVEPEHIIIIHIQFFLILCRLLLSKNLATFKICLPHTPTSDIKFISLLIYPEDSLWQKIPRLVHPDH